MTLRSIFRLSIAGLAVTGITAALFIASSRGASAQSQLPDGPGKDAVWAACAARVIRSSAPRRCA